MDYAPRALAEELEDDDEEAKPKQNCKKKSLGHLRPEENFFENHPDAHVLLSVTVELEQNYYYFDVG